MELQFPHQTIKPNKLKIPSVVIAAQSTSPPKPRTHTAPPRALGPGRIGCTSGPQARGVTCSKSPSGRERDIGEERKNRGRRVGKRNLPLRERHKEEHLTGLVIDYIVRFPRTGHNGKGKGRSLIVEGKRFTLLALQAATARPRSAFGVSHTGTGPWTGISNFAIRKINKKKSSSLATTNTLLSASQTHTHRDGGRGGMDRHFGTSSVYETPPAGPETTSGDASAPWSGGGPCESALPVSTCTSHKGTSCEACRVADVECSRSVPVQSQFDAELQVIYSLAC